MKKIIIAIDGFSSCGKSTIAKSLAKKLKYIYVDTGAMYRAVTFLALSEGLLTKINNVESVIDEEQLLEKLKNSRINFHYNEHLGFVEVFLNGNNIEKEIRSIAVANEVSKVAKMPSIRAYLLDLQRAMGIEKGIVMDGRDVGTTIFPNAELKIFMTADKKVRAQRRFDELKQTDATITIEEVQENLEQRDFIDSNRDISPLKQAADAKVLDNTDLTIEEQLELAYAWATALIEKNN